MRRKTGLYIRVSTDAQYEEGYSVEAQKEKLAQWCKLKDITNYEFYIDGGFSGSNIDRPEMKRLIGEITQGDISTVVVYKLDRLSRSQRDTIFLLEDVFIPNQTDFISVVESFDTSTSYGKAMIGILSVFAQLERENIRERTRMGMRERVKAGLWMGGGRLPFGYDYDREKNILVPDEHAEAVRQIYDLYLQGYSLGQLTNLFGLSSDAHTANILDRITYLGKINYNGEILEGQHEAVIDGQTWQKVQAEREKRSKRNAVTSTYLLTGLLYCGKCGAKMRYQKRSAAETKIYCYSQQKPKPNLVKDPNCDNERLDSEDIEAVVLQNLFKRTGESKGTDRKIETRTSSLQILQKKYDAVTGKIKRLYNLYATDGDELLLQTIEENKRELQSISKQLEDEKTTNRVADEINARHDVINNLESSWSKMTMMEKQRALRICIDRVEVTGNTVSIRFNW